MLREVEAKFRFIKRFAASFTDHRNREAIELPLVDLIKPRIVGICWLIAIVKTTDNLPIRGSVRKRFRSC